MINISSSIIMAILVALIFQSLSEANLKVNNCKRVTSAAANITKLEISSCRNYPCILKKNTNSTIKLGLHFTKKVTELKLRIAGILNGHDIPFHVNDKNHCQHTIKTAKNCTINKNSIHKYEFSLPVLKEYPNLYVFVRYELIDFKKNSVACFTFPARIDN